MSAQTTPLRVAHVMVTDNFAGVERYVTQTARELARRGHDVTVVGGSHADVPLALGESVRWLDGSTMRTALASLRQLGAVDVLHVHMTKAELVGVLVALPRRQLLVATRHFARRRGSSPLGRLFSRAFNRRVDCQIAISDFVAAHVEARPDVILRPGTSTSDAPYAAESRAILMIQRLEPEKATLEGLKIWQASGLQELGWRLEIVGDGSERSALEAWVDTCGLTRSVKFRGWTDDVPARLATAALVLAPTPSEAFGLSVLEAMAAGVPTVASASGGHLETVGQIRGLPGFSPGDIAGTGAQLRALALDESRRCALSAAVRGRQRSDYTTTRHADCLEIIYRDLTRAGLRRAPPSG